MIHLTTVFGIHEEKRETRLGKDITKVIYDCHAHIYPEKIAAKAVEGVGNFYGIPMDCPSGTADALLAIGDDAWIDRFLVHSVATEARQVERINDFLAATVAKEPRFIGFGTMHADYEGKADELERMIGMGLRGVKIHPDSQHYTVDDPRMFELYDALQGRYPILVHCGDYRYDYDNPDRVRRVLDMFPRLTFIAAHFGGWSLADLALEYLKDSHCYFDCSSSMMYIGQKRSAELIREYGAERFLFGSDYPMWSPKDELERFRSLDISEEEKEMILTHNPEKVLHL